MIAQLIRYGAVSTAGLVVLYATFLGLLTTASLQAHVVYLHKLQMTWFKDLNVPEMFGFMRNQVAPFAIPTSTGEELFAWHILPIELYRKHESELISETSGFVSDVASRTEFKLLSTDADAKLVIHMHGAGGTVASGCRVPNYRALSAGQPEKIHVLTFDYRGFGHSKGSPSEQSLCSDAVSVVNWAMSAAGIPPSRILIYSQSLGTAVALATLEHFASQPVPVTFAGAVLTAPFVNVATLVSTYRVAGTIPLLSPLARFPSLFEYLSKTFIRDPWPSKDRIARYVRMNEANKEKYRLTLIHAKDDYDIPWHHTETLYQHAVNATFPAGIGFDAVEEVKARGQRELGAAGSILEFRTDYGILRQEILEYGLHDVIMGNAVTTMTVTRIFEDPHS